jgi:hypothetical protein
MLNHSSEPSRRATSLLKLDLPMEVEVEGEGTVKFNGFFSMKAGEGEHLLGLVLMGNDVLNLLLLLMLLLMLHA